MMAFPSLGELSDFGNTSFSIGHIQSDSGLLGVLLGSSSNMDFIYFQASVKVPLKSGKLEDKMGCPMDDL